MRVIENILNEQENHTYFGAPEIAGCSCWWFVTLYIISKWKNSSHKSVTIVTSSKHKHIVKYTQPFYGPLGFTGARDSEWQWHQLGHVQICTLIQSQPSQHPTTEFFTGWIPFLLPNKQRQSNEGKLFQRHTINIGDISYVHLRPAPSLNSTTCQLH